MRTKPRLYLDSVVFEDSKRVLISSEDFPVLICFTAPILLLTTPLSVIEEFLDEIDMLLIINY